jgi:hypothetical protein
MHRCNCHEQFHNQVDLASCDISEHLLDCANRTVKCPICQKYIRQAILNYHCYNNCIDLDEGENISIAAGNKNSELASRIQDRLLIIIFYCFVYRIIIKR